MSMQPHAPTGSPSTNLILESWRHWFRFAGAASNASLEAARLFWDLRPARDRWLAEASRQMDGYLRSPAFLQLMGASQQLMSRSIRAFVPPSRK